MENFDDYLAQDFGLIRNSKYLKTENCIAEYFGDRSDLFDCGQGYYQDTEQSLVMTEDGKFYEVTTTAEIGSAKQDVGERLYWVEGIESVEFKEVDKPEPKARERITVEFEVYVDGRDPFLRSIEALSCSSRVLP